MDDEFAFLDEVLRTGDSELDAIWSPIVGETERVMAEAHGLDSGNSHH